MGGSGEWDVANRSGGEDGYAGQHEEDNGRDSHPDHKPSGNYAHLQDLEKGRLKSSSALKFVAR